MQIDPSLPTVIHLVVCIFGCFCLSLWQVSSLLAPKLIIRREMWPVPSSSLECLPPVGREFQSDMKDSCQEREDRHKEPIKMSGLWSRIVGRGRPEVLTRLNSPSRACWRRAARGKRDVTMELQNKPDFGFKSRSLFSFESCRDVPSVAASQHIFTWYRGAVNVRVNRSCSRGCPLVPRWQL